MSRFTLPKKSIKFLDNNRIYILFVVVLVFMCLFAPKFFSARNFTTILRSASMNALAAIGFTIVLICAQLDLSLGSVISLGAVFTVGFRLQFSALAPTLAWGTGFLIAVAAGAVVGLINGVLVAKVKITSFIVTLGTMITVQGIIYMYTDISLSATQEVDFALSDFLREPLWKSVGLITPRVLVSILCIALFEIMLTRTKTGRNIYLVGGNAEAAWLAGISPQKYIIFAYVLAGFLYALAGSLGAMEMSAAPTDFGAKSLMIVISAAIIGGTSMAGGKGSALKSAIAVLMLETLFNGLNRFKVGSEVKIFVSGVIFASVILYEAYALYKHEETKGQRAELL
jgi:ribose transport system permease protein